MPYRKLRVLVVDDSPLFCETISKLLSHDENIEVIATAYDAFQAREKVISLRPDVITLDIEMPKMNGIEFLKVILPIYPCPVVVCTSMPVGALDALEAGAVDFVKKPVVTNFSELSEFGSKLATIIKIASNAKLIKAGNKTYQVVDNSAYQPLLNALDSKLIAIGASTGGTEALPAVINRMPANSPPIVVVQHMPAGFTSMFAQRLNQSCNLEVVEGRHGMYLKKSQVVIAEGGKHIRVFKDAKGYFISTTSGEKVAGHCPSVDVMFESVAMCAKKDAVGVILTGMGSDGASGLQAIKNAGGYTIGQSEEGCVVYGMPRVAFNIGAVKVQRPLDKIAEEIVDYLSKQG